jgi:hypothetical protein
VFEAETAATLPIRPATGQGPDPKPPEARPVGVADARRIERLRFDAGRRHVVQPAVRPERRVDGGAVGPVGDDEDGHLRSICSRVSPVLS